MADGDVVNLDPDACAVRRVDPDKIARAAERSPRPREVSDLAELFKLLGDPTRLRILYALVEAGELCVCDLAAVVDAPESSVSHALRLLRMAGVVCASRRGRMAYYAIDDHHVAVDHLRHGQGR